MVDMPKGIAVILSGGSVYAKAGKSYCSASTILELQRASCHQAAMTFRPVLRPALESDIPAITDLYAHYVLHSTASFETVPPDTQEMARRRQNVLKTNLPYMVAEIGGIVVGYAYATPYRPRAAYRFTVEDSIYVHRDYAGNGIGRLLLAALIEACEKNACRQMLAVIGGQDNTASVRLHHGFGFRQVGLLQSVGFKFGAWVDTVLMQRGLGLGDAGMPDDAQVPPANP
jgi:L-amino acid N-acyltransferase YncA